MNRVQIRFWTAVFSLNPNGIPQQSPGLRVVPVRKDRATLGNGSEEQNPNGVSAPKNVDRVATPMGLFAFGLLTQGSSCLATLGFRTQSLRDWQISKLHVRPH